MGLLEDAIREHLDLMRRTGSNPAEIARMEHEALGPPQPIGASAPAAEADVEGEHPAEHAIRAHDPLEGEHPLPSHDEEHPEGEDTFVGEHPPEGERTLIGEHPLPDEPTPPPSLEHEHGAAEQEGEPHDEHGESHDEHGEPRRHWFRRARDG